MTSLFFSSKYWKGIESSVSALAAFWHGSPSIKTAQRDKELVILFTSKCANKARIHRNPAGSLPGIVFFNAFGTV